MTCCLQQTKGGHTLKSAGRFGWNAAGRANMQYEHCPWPRNRQTKTTYFELLFRRVPKDKWAVGGLIRQDVLLNGDDALLPVELGRLLAELAEVLVHSVHASTGQGRWQRNQQ